MLVLLNDERVLLLPRPPAGSWGGLLSLPEIADESEAEAVAARLGCEIVSRRELAPRVHTFTHFRLTMRPLVCEVLRLQRAGEPDARWLRDEDLARAPLPAPIRKLLAVLFHEPVV